MLFIDFASTFDYASRIAYYFSRLGIYGTSHKMLQAIMECEYRLQIKMIYSDTSHCSNGLRQ